MMRPKTLRHRSRDFIAFAKRLHGPCCICGIAPGYELHHWGESGMGLRGSDFRVARVCRSCHTGVQGKGRIACARENMMDIYAAMLEDSVEILEAYAARGGQDDSV